MAQRYRDPKQRSKDTICILYTHFCIQFLLIFVLNVFLLFVLPELGVKPIKPTNPIGLPDHRASFWVEPGLV